MELSLYQKKKKRKEKVTYRTQVANIRPTGWIRPTALFYPAWHLVSTRRQCRALTQLLRSSYIYTALKWHLALWRQLWGWCGAQWKWVWHPILYKMSDTGEKLYKIIIKQSRRTESARVGTGAEMLSGWSGKALRIRWHLSQDLLWVFRRWGTKPFREVAYGYQFFKVHI